MPNAPIPVQQGVVVPSGYDLSSAPGTTTYVTPQPTYIVGAPVVVAPPVVYGYGPGYGYGQRYAPAFYPPVGLSLNLGFSSGHRHHGRHGYGHGHRGPGGRSHGWR